MVTRPRTSRLSPVAWLLRGAGPLDRKLLRDLLRIRGQAVAIGLVIALGVLVLVMMDGLVNTLEETRRAYYERYRLAELFAPLERAPAELRATLRGIPGVAAVESRVTGDALLDLPDVDLPLRARAVSLPASAAPRLNAVHLTAGRVLDPLAGDEVLLLEGFARARNLQPGDTLRATMNGVQRRFRIVGLAGSPEFVYTTAPGELVPDDSRFAVLWMNEAALSAAYDMQGAFSEALLSLGPEASLPAVIAAVDRVLDPYGGLGAYALEDQASNRFVSEEIAGLKASAVTVPPIFMAVAAFLLYIVVSRIVQSEREQIGLLKAFGYSGRETGLHYLKLVLLIATGGALAGSLLGILAGRYLAGFYQTYFKFPFIVFQLDANAFFTGFLVSILSASIGGLLVLRRVFAMTPAVAMRPPIPVDYSHTRRLARGLKAVLDQPSRMVMRRVLRQSGRMAGSMLGIATGMALSVAMISLYAGFDRTIELTFSVLDRSDATVVFTHPRPARSVFDLKHLDGVLHVEPFRQVAVIFRNGRRQYRGAISGLIEGPRLFRALDRNLAPIALPGRGVALSRPVADLLDVKPGDLLSISVREGRRPVLELPVEGISESLLGSPVYMRLDALNRALGEPGRVSGAYLGIDAARRASVYRAVKDMPAVAGISLKRQTRDAIVDIMNTGAGAMRYVMALVAGVITFGIVYNAARIAYTERERDLASMRVLGFTRAETAFVLLGELAVVTLAALPVGAVAGHQLSQAIARGFSTDIYQVPAIYSPESIGAAAIAVLLAAVASGWLVKRDTDRLDPVAALKARE